jgi:hypothetical protein
MFCSACLPRKRDEFPTLGLDTFVKMDLFTAVFAEDHHESTPSTISKLGGRLPFLIPETELFQLLDYRAPLVPTDAVLDEIFYGSGQVLGPEFIGGAKWAWNFEFCR